LDFFRELQSKGQNNETHDILDVQWDRFIPKQSGIDLISGKITRVNYNVYYPFFFYLITFK